MTTERKGKTKIKCIALTDEEIAKVNAARRVKETLPSFSEVIADLINTHLSCESLIVKSDNTRSAKE